MSTKHDGFFVWAPKSWCTLKLGIALGKSLRHAAKTARCWKCTHTTVVHYSSVFLQATLGVAVKKINLRYYPGSICTKHYRFFVLNSPWRQNGSMMKMQGDNLFIYLFQWKWGSYVYFPDVICLLSAILDMFYAFLTLPPPCVFFNTSTAPCS